MDAQHRVSVRALVSDEPPTNPVFGTAPGYGNNIVRNINTGPGSGIGIHIGSGNSPAKFEQASQEDANTQMMAMNIQHMNRMGIHGSPGGRGHERGVGNMNVNDDDNNNYNNSNKMRSGGILPPVSAIEPDPNKNTHWMGMNVGMKPQQQDASVSNRNPFHPMGLEPTLPAPWVTGSGNQGAGPVLALGPPGAGTGISPQAPPMSTTRPGFTFDGRPWNERESIAVSALASASAVPVRSSSGYTYSGTPNGGDPMGSGIGGSNVPQFGRADSYELSSRMEAAARIDPSHIASKGSFKSGFPRVAFEEGIAGGFHPGSKHGFDHDDPQPIGMGARSFSAPADRNQLARFAQLDAEQMSEGLGGREDSKKSIPDDMDQDIQLKKARRKLLNRESAQRSRARRAMHVDSLSNAARKLQQENESLHAKVRALEHELQLLKEGKASMTDDAGPAAPATGAPKGAKEDTVVKSDTPKMDTSDTKPNASPPSLRAKYKVSPEVATMISQDEVTGEDAVRLLHMLLTQAADEK